MFLLIVTLALGIILAIVGGLLVAAGSPNQYEKQERHSALIGTGIVIIFVGLLISVGSIGWTEIGPGQVGVVVNLGKVDTNELSSGINWRVPIISSIHIMDTRIQAYQFGGDPQGDTAKPENQGIETFTSENQPAYMYGVVNYSIDPTWAAELYQSVGDDWFNKVVASQSQSEIKQDARQYSVDEITKQRDALAKAAQIRLQNDVAQYHINITGVFINNIRLSADYLTAVTAKQIALQNVEKVRADADAARQTAQGVADSNVITAKGQALATVQLAQGQATANQDISASLTDLLVRWQTVQKLSDDIKVWIVPQGSNNLFNLGSPTASTTP